MANLPINISTAPAQVSSPTAISSDTAPQDSQGFGEVLARQVADTAGSVASDGIPADTTGKDSAVPLVLVDNKPTIVPDATSTLPADMLATLLIQQNPNVTPGAVSSPLQSLAINELKTSSTNIPLAAKTITTTALGSGTAASLDALVENSALPQSVLDKIRSGAAIINTAQDKPTFTEALKGTATNELSPSASVESTIKLSIAEHSAAPQQPAATGVTPNSSLVAVTTVPIANSTTVNTPVGQPGWSNDLGQKITWLAGQNNQSAELHLNPPQLGPLDVVLKVSGDQATALFASPHAAVRDAIELALPKLREMLADNGIMLGNATVSDQASRKGQDDFARAQQGAGNSASPVAEVEAVGHQGGRVTAIRHHNGLVDTFA